VNVQFATCDVTRAAEYVRRVYPDRKIPDAVLAPLLDLVGRDILRVQDPMMYGNRIAVVPGKKYHESHRESCERVGRELTAALLEGT
jgi:hypothetical protein